LPARFAILPDAFSHVIIPVYETINHFLLLASGFLLVSFGRFGIPCE